MSGSNPNLASKTTREEASATRRDWLGSSALWALLTTTAAALIGIIRLPKPSVLPGPRQVYRIGSPDDFQIGAVTLVESGTIFVYRAEEGLHAISGICTHLGCTVKPDKEGGYSCPCHGSQFDSQGRVVRGPAPRGLPWLRLALLANGQLEVDTEAEVPRGSNLVV